MESLPSTRPGQSKTIIVSILGPINANTDSNDALACHGDNTPTDYGNPPGEKEQEGSGISMSKKES